MRFVRFGKLYHLGQDILSHSDYRWFNELAESDCLSHPYDPLAVLLLLHPEQFLPVSVKEGAHQLVGGTPEVGSSMDK